MSDPWATPEVGYTEPRPVAPPGGRGSGAGGNGAYIRGVAPVGVPRPRVEDTRPGLDQPPPTRPWRDEFRVPVRSQMRQLGIGSGWTKFGALFAFVCWGIWAISARGNDISGLTLTFFLVLAVAAGLFALLRLLGRVVLERSLGRFRRGARGSHLATGVFLAAAGIAFLGQTTWVVDAWNWLKDMIW